MRTLTQCELEQVDGAFLVPLLKLALFGVAIFCAPSQLKQANDDMNQWGKDWSQDHWDNKYPYDPNSPECYGPYC